jgi:hypothetical protein
MGVADAGVLQAGAQGILGKAALAGIRHGADIRQGPHLRIPQGGDQALGIEAFVPDGEQNLHGTLLCPKPAGTACT